MKTKGSVYQRRPFAAIGRVEPQGQGKKSQDV